MSLRTYLICRIIFTSLFVIISTNIWFTRKVEVYHVVPNNVLSHEVVISNLRRLSDDDDNTYKLELENKNDDALDIKVYIVPSLVDESVSNNYIKYQVNDGNVKTLNMDGIIIISKLEALEKKDINLKVWLSDTYEGNLNYEGRIVVA